MKHIFLLFFLISSFHAVCQENFEWDIRVESSKTKEQLYSDTKMFIAEIWNSAQSVIQNDDKEKGLILVKGLSSQSLYYQMNNHEWTYSYTVKFYVKDNKYRIVIDNVHCQSAICGIYDWPLMPVADNYPEKKGMRITGVNEKRYNLLMNRLKEELQSIVDNYLIYVDNVTEEEEDW